MAARSVSPVAAGAMAAGAALAVLGVGSVASAVVLGAVAAAAAAGARRSAAAAADSAALRDAPLFLDVVASHLRSGAPVALALDRSAPLAPAPLIAVLDEVAGLIRLGASPAAAWQGLEGTVLADLALLARRSSDSGVRLAEQARHLAQHMRAQSADRAAAAARRAGVWAMAPLGLCFLPAFLCLGVAPVILGLGRQALTAGGVLG